jgi:hypothetical protein
MAGLRQLVRGRERISPAEKLLALQQNGHEQEKQAIDCRLQVKASFRFVKSYYLAGYKMLF